MTATLIAPASTGKISASGQIHPIDKHEKYWQCGNHAISFGVTDEDAAFLWQQFKQQDLQRIIFYESPLSLAQFIAFCLNPATNSIACFREDPADFRWRIEGFIMIRNIITMGGGKFRRGDVGEGFFRGCLNPLIYAQMAIEYGFTKLNLDVLSGITPEPNRAGRIFPRKLGFDVVGPLPGCATWDGQLCSVMFSSLTKDKWNTISPWK